jgi:hypothetical protein
MSITKPGFLLAAVLAAALLGKPADAQQPGTQAGPPPAKIALTSLLTQGFEIKAAVAANADYQVVFLQKGKDAFACIAAHLAPGDPWKSDCYPVE